MGNNKDLFDYWFNKVEILNLELIKSGEHIPTQQLRHECTNYDQLRFSQEVQALEAEEKDKVIVIIKYQCTARVLQARAGYFREKASYFKEKSNQYKTEKEEINQQRSKLLKLIKELQEKLFGNGKVIKELETRIALLEAENEALRADADKANAYTELLKEFGELEKKYADLQKHREKLAKKNQSLGGRVAHTTRFQEQRDLARATVKEQSKQIATLEKENVKLKAENEKLRQQVEKLKQKSI